jgi:hypothetical protein
MAAGPREGSSLPGEIPPEAVPFLREAGYLEPDPLSPGDAAPDGALTTLDGAGAALAALWRRGPAVLIFGSYT